MQDDNRKAKRTRRWRLSGLRTGVKSGGLMVITTSQATPAFQMLRVASAGNYEQGAGKHQKLRRNVTPNVLGRFVR